MCVFFIYFSQICYDLTGSLARNKDSLPQNILFMMKCKYPTHTTRVTTLWRQSKPDHKDALLYKPAQHTQPLFVPVWLFLFNARFIPYVADSTARVYIVHRRCQMWGVVVSGDRAPLCDCQAGHASSSLIAVISMMRLIY